MLLYSHYKGSYIVLIFHPMNFTVLCPPELYAFNENLEEYRNAVWKYL
ncbi:MAG: hypothetical protein DWQ05_01185 [Calditrichaeota bacterium]|nr:MAG: hypothetical protein DWQ05_01185 [Calditrichota bacterium]